MWTVILSVLIFGACGKIIWNFFKTGTSCEECTSECVVKEFSKKS